MVQSSHEQVRSCGWFDPTHETWQVYVGKQLISRGVAVLTKFQAAPCQSPDTVIVIHMFTSERQRAPPRGMYK